MSKALEISSTGSSATLESMKFTESKHEQGQYWSSAEIEDETKDVEERKPFSEKHQKRMRRAKRKHRTDLDDEDWQLQAYSRRWKEIKAELLRRAVRYPAVIHIETVEEFREKFEEQREPCILLNCAESWPAKYKWSLHKLRSRFGDVKLKCGEDDDGYPIKVKLETFCRYIENQKDDSPLYIFDTSFERNCKELLNEYKVPQMFPEDLFEMVGDRRRPPHRWFLIGPERSGTTVHIDPLETSAWNTSLRGRKLWVMFPPDVSRQVVKGKRHVKRGGDDEAVDYFSYMLDGVLQDLTEEQRERHLLFVQQAGQTVFVPHGWWHAVINLDDTVAITHNYVGSVNFPYVWRSVRVERRKMARKWRSELKVHRPDLYAIAKQIDKEDDFDLEEEIERHKQEKKEKKRRKLEKKH